MPSEQVQVANSGTMGYYAQLLNMSEDDFEFIDYQSGSLGGGLTTVQAQYIAKEYLSGRPVYLDNNYGTILPIAGFQLGPDGDDLITLISVIGQESLEISLRLSVVSGEQIAIDDSSQGSE